MDNDTNDTNWWETVTLLPFSTPTTILICGSTQSGFILPLFYQIITAKCKRDVYKTSAKNNIRLFGVSKYI